jgi:hypothetical protein
LTDFSDKIMRKGIAHDPEKLPDFSDKIMRLKRSCSHRAAAPTSDVRRGKGEFHKIGCGISPARFGAGSQ